MQQKVYKSLVPLTHNMSSELVPTKVVDYLDEDPSIRGQNYVCLSFLSPEDVIANKEVFYVEKFLANFAKDATEFLAAIEKLYPDSKNICDGVRENHGYLFKGGRELQEQFKFFKSMNSASLDAEYNENNEFRTSVRGIKVRGVYETVAEAQNRAKYLKKQNDKFDIFVGQVGCWCPWSPNVDDIQDQEYAESQLNTLMREYRNQLSLRDKEFDERKRVKIAAAKADAASSSAEAAAQQLIENEDPWLAQKTSSDP
jgi:Family of unknown function (DUF5832)